MSQGVRLFVGKFYLIINQKSNQIVIHRQVYADRNRETRKLSVINTCLLKAHLRSHLMTDMYQFSLNRYWKGLMVVVIRT